jgi:2-polyprenyl-6-methoxyphenol hydroxylase-like FAD-dependent oxidoreductase
VIGMGSYDVAIVGMRCAGAALAMLLARAGYRVLGVDRVQFPSDTISTHFMWPRTTAFLAAWGLLDRLSATGCPAIDRVTVDYGGVAISGRPSPVDGTAIMYCPRRTVLDLLLVEAARAAGAEIRQATTFRELVRSGDRVIGLRVQDSDGTVSEARAELVVGADGLWSAVARAAGAQTDIEHEALTCGYYAYWAGVPTNGVEVYVRHGRDILVFPTHDGLTCIWAGRSRVGWPVYRGNVEASYREIVALAPKLAERVNGARRASAFKGTGKLPNFYRQSFGLGWALVGDAAYHRDPLTGMGIGDAFLGAHLLSAAIADGLGKSQPQLLESLVAYQTAFRERTKPVFDYTVRAAGLADPASSVGLYAKIADHHEATRRFMDVLAGAMHYRELFNPSELARLTGS